MENSNLESRIQDTFLKLAKKIPLEEIDVSKICANLKITRQAFYYHYKNIFDLIFSIYIDKRLTATNLASLKEIVHDLIIFLYKDEMFNKEVADSNVKDALKEYCFSYLFQSFSLYLNKFNDIEVAKKRKIAKYLSNAVSEEVLELFVDNNYDQKRIEDEILLYLDDKIIEQIVFNFKKV